LDLAIFGSVSIPHRVMNAFPSAMKPFATVLLVLL